MPITDTQKRLHMKDGFGDLSKRYFTILTEILQETQIYHYTLGLEEVYRA